MISDLRAAKDELEVTEESRSEVEKVVTLEKDRNSPLMVELEQMKKRLVYFEVREEEYRAQEKKTFLESEEFFDLLGSRSVRVWF